ncbi:MAG: hypothetical protein QOF70_2906, partial [Acetobacteraceae bacterium]|nr:hypothetical protein [Acetobacteraceae bacterium]
LQQWDFLPGRQGSELGRLGFPGSWQDGSKFEVQSKLVKTPVRPNSSARASAPQDAFVGHSFLPR